MDIGRLSARSSAEYSVCHMRPIMTQRLGSLSKITENLVSGYGLQLLGARDIFEKALSY